MRKRYLWLLIGLVLAVIVPLTVRADDPPPLEVQRAAELGLPEFLSAIPADSLAEYGFRTPEEAALATLGRPIRVYLLPPDAMLDPERRDSLSLRLQTTQQWLFPVYVHDEPRTTLLVERSVEGYRAVRLGNTILPEMLTAWERLLPIRMAERGHGSYDVRYVRIPQIYADFLLVTAEGAEYIAPLSLPLEMGHLSSEQLHTADRILSTLSPVVARSLMTRDLGPVPEADSAPPALPVPARGLAGAKDLDVPAVKQEQSQWCWAGCARAVFLYYGQDVPQCTIADYNWSRSDCCTDPSGTACNQPTFLSLNVQSILLHWGVDSRLVGSAVSWDTTVDEIDAGRPVWARWGWTGGGGHFLLVHGYDDDAGQKVTYMDPSPGQRYVADYAWMAAGGSHTWSHSLYYLDEIGTATPTPTATSHVTATPTATSLVTPSPTSTATPTPTANPPATPTFTPAPPSPTATPATDPYPEPVTATPTHAPSGEAYIQGSVDLQGRPAPPNSQWITPLEITLLEDGQPVSVSSGTTDTYGEFVAGPFAAGTYDVRVKGLSSLSNLRRGVVLVPGINAVHFGELLEGDASGDNLVDIDDFAFLLDAFGEPDPVTDFNRDGVVDIDDFGLLKFNFGKYGDIVLP